MKSINPFDGSVIREYREHDDNDVVATIDAAWQAFQCWRDVGFKEKSDLMKRVASLLKDNVEEYARLITQEMGKIIRVSRAPF